MTGLKNAARDALWVLKSRGPSQMQFWFIALVIGIAAGCVAVMFRLVIETLEGHLYNTANIADIPSAVAELPWYTILVIPIIGGLCVGIILDRFTNDGRVRSVADVIEGSALYNGRVLIRSGLASAAASMITLFSGGSSGREGPVVHLAAVVSTLICRLIRANGITGRDLLGCAVAAAVSASFNAPLAGALFAMEVVLRHFALHSFAPIAIASVAGAVINRLAFGDVTEFVLPVQNALAFYVELPAFLFLGVVCGVVAVCLIKAIFWAEDLASFVQNAARLPRFLRPAVAGALLGALAIWWPHIIGVGYATTSAALTGELLFNEAVVFALLKILAVAITMGGRMGGGVFSPALMIGALTGLAFGIVATAIFPTVSGEGTIYALAGMGAVAAAVLGAPISTTLIVFELTGDWQTGIAVMVAVSMSSALSSKMITGSFFMMQLQRRGLDLAAGPQDYLLKTLKVANLIRAVGAPNTASAEACQALIDAEITIVNGATLHQAMPLFDQTGHDFIPVMSAEDVPELVGALFHIDALKAVNKALVETSAEEHA